MDIVKIIEQFLGMVSEVKNEPLATRTHTRVEEFLRIANFRAVFKCFLPDSREGMDEVVSGPPIKP
jgi:hypothetical protein